MNDGINVEALKENLNLCFDSFVISYYNFVLGNISRYYLQMMLKKMMTIMIMMKIVVALTPPFSNLIVPNFAL